MDGWLKGAAYGVLAWLAAMMAGVLGILRPELGEELGRLLAMLRSGVVLVPVLGALILVAWRATAMPHQERAFF